MRSDRLARLHAAVDRQAGERIRIVPYTAGGQLVGKPDTTRIVVDLVATVSEVPKVGRTLGTGNTTGRNADMRLVSHAAKFTTSALPYELADGDHIVLLDRGGAELKVHHSDPFGTDRTVAHLETLKKRPA